MKKHTLSPLLIRRLLARLLDGSLVIHHDKQDIPQLKLSLAFTKNGLPSDKAWEPDDEE